MSGHNNSKPKKGHYKLDVGPCMPAPDPDEQGWFEKLLPNTWAPYGTIRERIKENGEIVVHRRIAIQASVAPHIDNTGDMILSKRLHEMIDRLNKARCARFSREAPKEDEKNERIRFRSHRGGRYNRSRRLGPSHVNVENSSFAQAALTTPPARATAAAGEEEKLSKKEVRKV